MIFLHANLAFASGDWAADAIPQQADRFCATMSLCIMHYRRIRWIVLVCRGCFVPVPRMHKDNTWCSAFALYATVQVPSRYKSSAVRMCPTVSRSWRTCGCRPVCAASPLLAVAACAAHGWCSGFPAPPLSTAAPALAAPTAHPANQSILDSAVSTSGGSVSCVTCHQPHTYQ